MEEIKKKLTYKTNVANNFLFRSLNSTIDTAVISISEQIANYNKISKGKIISADIKKLRNHRHVMSHPATIEFDNREVQAFYQSKEHYRDNIAVRLWRVRQLLITFIESKNGRAITPLGVHLQSGVCEMVHTIFNLSRNSQFQLSFDDVYRGIVPYFKGYEKNLIMLVNKNTFTEPATGGNSTQTPQDQ
jgi:hypothetical protein